MFLGPPRFSASAHAAFRKGMAVWSVLSWSLFWRVLVLACIGRDDLTQDYDFNEPWDSPNNLHLVSRMPDFFRTPGDGRPPTTGVTNIVAVVGPETAWPGDRARSRNEFGERKVLLFVETFASGIPWTEPRDLSVEELTAELAPELTVVRWWLKLPPAGWNRARPPIGRAVVLSDGSAHFVQGDLSPKAVRTLATAPRSGARRWDASVGKACLRRCMPADFDIVSVPGPDYDAPQPPAHPGR